MLARKRSKREPEPGADAMKVWIPGYREVRPVRCRECGRLAGNPGILSAHIVAFHADYGDIINMEFLNASCPIVENGKA